MELLKHCMLCPKKCGVNRYETVGACGANHKIKIAYYSLHKWEEPVLSGKNGSGTIFFSHCSLRCLYCQNKKISIDGYGKIISKAMYKEIKEAKGITKALLWKLKFFLKIIINSIEKYSEI